MPKNAYSDTNILPLKRRTIVFAIHPLQAILNMLIQPVPLQPCLPHLPGPHNISQTPLFLAKAIKRLHHAPLRAWIEERQDVPLMQVPKPRHPHLHSLHVKLEGRIAGVVDVEQVRVEVDVATAGRFDRRPGTVGDEEVIGDRREKCAGREGD